MTYDLKPVHEAIDSAYSEVEYALDELRVLISKEEENFDALDEAACIIYRFDDDVLPNKEDTYQAVVTARDTAEGRRDDLYEDEEYLELVLNNLEEADQNLGWI